VAEVAVLKIIKTEIAAVLVEAARTAIQLQVAKALLVKETVVETEKLLGVGLLAVVAVLVLKVRTVLMVYK
jgi:hypothetical protein